MKNRKDALQRAMRSRARRGKERAQARGAAWEDVSYEKLFQERPPKCPLCHRAMPEVEVLDVDHIVPIQEGGGHVRENLRVVHMWCHRREHLGLRHGPPIWVGRKPEGWKEKRRPALPKTIRDLWKRKI